jgi:hypothetical protein
VLVGLFVVLLILGGVSALSVRRNLNAGRDAVQSGKQQLSSGDPAGATTDFDQASSHFSEAASGARSIPLRVLGWLPFLGRTPDAVAAVAEAGQGTAQAGAVMSHAIDGLPDGIQSLAPRNGAIPIRPLRAIVAPLARANALMTQAYDTIHAAPSTLLVGPVGDARRLAEEQLGPLHDTLSAASRIVAGLPAFLGADHPSHYYFAAAGPAEQRGTGGLIGAYSIMTIEGGRVRFSPFRPVEDLPTPRVGDVPSPSEEFSRNYDTFRAGKGFWLNINMTPDFPVAAEATRLAIQDQTNQRIDGVVQADPFALKALLELTGSATVPGLGITVDASNVVPFTTNEAYVQFAHDSEARKLVLGDVAKSVVERFFDQSDPSVGGLRKLVGTMAEGHIQVYSADPRMEQGLEATGVGGALPRPSGDFLSVVQNNGGGQKIDFYADRTVGYAVDLLGDGSATAKLDVGLKNSAPDRGLPPYIIGPIPGVSKIGENDAIFSTYCPADCVLQQAHLNGRSEDLRSGTELGYRYYQGQFQVPSEQSGGYDADLELPSAWEGNSSGGVYHLTFWNQTTIRPTHVHIEIRIPDGMQVRSTSEGLSQQGDVVVYDGVPQRSLELQVSFSPPLPQRLVRNVTRLFTQPVIHL